MSSGWGVGRSEDFDTFYLTWKARKCGSSGCLLSPEKLASTWRLGAFPEGQLWGRVWKGNPRGVAPGDQPLLRTPNLGAFQPRRDQWGSPLILIGWRLVPSSLLKGPPGPAGLGLGAEHSSGCLVSALLPPPWRSEWLEPEPRPPTPGFRGGTASPGVGGAWKPSGTGPPAGE